MSSFRIHILQHVFFENEGAIQDWAERREYQVSRTCLFRQEPLPKLEDFDLLVIMGGPMNIYEEEKYEWLKTEKAFIRQAIDAQKKILGICLGAQLLADALGSRIYANSEKEIGWFPIDWQMNQDSDADLQNFPASSTVLQWHGDTFDLPQGASLLATSPVCQNQAFSYKHQVYGFQFHLESTEEGIEALLENCGDEIQKAPFIQSKEVIRSKTTLDQLKENHNLLEKMLGYVLKQPIESA